MYDACQRPKRIDYQYDLVSGKVNSVAYQTGQPDALMHFYKYDAENWLTDVYTSSDSVTVEHEARYEYYKQGLLARTLIGQNQVQGLDYAVSRPPSSGSMIRDWEEDGIWILNQMLE